MTIHNLIGNVVEHYINNSYNFTPYFKLRLVKNNKIWVNGTGGILGWGYIGELGFGGYDGGVTTDDYY